MTVDQLILSLQRIAAGGHGGLQVLGDDLLNEQSMPQPIRVVRLMRHAPAVVLFIREEQP